MKKYTLHRKHYVIVYSKKAARKHASLLNQIFPGQVTIAQIEHDRHGHHKILKRKVRRHRR